MVASLTPTTLPASAVASICRCPNRLSRAVVLGSSCAFGPVAGPRMGVDQMATNVNVIGQPMLSSCGGASPELCETCLAQPACARVLRLLYARPTTVMALADIAAGSGLAESEARSALDRLGHLGFLRQVALGGALTFYGITEDDLKLEDARHFRFWGDEQRQHWDAVRDVIG
jgi:hypothetical protein